MIQDWRPLLYEEKLRILRYRKLREGNIWNIELQIKGYGDKEKNNQIPDSHFPIVYTAEDGLVNRYYVCAVAFLGTGTTTTSASKGFTLLDKKKSGIKEKF